MHINNKNHLIKILESMRTVDDMEIIKCMIESLIDLLQEEIMTVTNDKVKNEKIDK